MSACGVSYGPLDGGPQTSPRPNQVDRQVPHVATASTEAHVEHDGGFVLLGHAFEHCVRFIFRCGIHHLHLNYLDKHKGCFRSIFGVLHRVPLEFLFFCSLIRFLLAHTPSL
jgi:hypothetical protein